MVAAILAAGVFFSLPSQAVPILYSFSGSGSGDLDGGDFNDAAFEVQLIANTNDITGPPDFLRIEGLAATISIDGLGLLTFQGPITIFTTDDAVGISETGPVIASFLELFHPFIGFELFTLDNDFGPVVVAPNAIALSRFDVIETQSGFLSFDAMSDVSFESTLLDRDIQSIELEQGVHRVDDDPQYWFLSLEFEGNHVDFLRLVSPEGVEVPKRAQFPSLAAMQEDFPAGTYQVFDGSEFLGTVDFTPVFPDGEVTSSFPTHLEKNVELEPMLLFSSNCTNCTGLGLVLTDLCGSDLFEADFPTFATFWSPGTLLMGRSYGFAPDNFVETSSAEQFGDDPFDWTFRTTDVNSLRFTTPPIGSLLEISEAEILATELGGNDFRFWLFEAAFEQPFDSGITSASLEPLHPFATGAPLELSEDEPLYWEAFAVFQMEEELRQAYPDGPYRMDFNGGVESGGQCVILDYGPERIPGFATITLPEEDAITTTTPNFAWDLCDGCEVHRLFVTVEDEVLEDDLCHDELLAGSTSVLFSELTCPELAPSRLHEFSIDLATEDESSEMLGEHAFTYQANNLRITELSFTTEGDVDSDGVLNHLDNCPTIPNGPLSGPNDQLDGDSDQVGDVCDNCVTFPNPRGVPLYFDVRFTGDQLDSDEDGYGNACDADFNQALPNFNGAPDLLQFSAAFGKSREDFDCPNDNGSPGGPCAEFDLDGNLDFIGIPDLIRFQLLFGGPSGPKCDDCPLPNLNPIVF